jgi:hypothetical protein
VSAKADMTSVVINRSEPRNNTGFDLSDIGPPRRSGFFDKGSKGLHGPKMKMMFLDVELQLNAGHANSPRIVHDFLNVVN